jgi:hypothetical protein
VADAELEACSGMECRTFFGVAGFAHKPKKNMENSTKKKSDGILLLARRYTPLQKYQYASYLYILTYLKVRG